MDDFYAVIYKSWTGSIQIVNLAANGKYEDHSITRDVRHAEEVVRYMTATVGDIGYKAVKVKFEELQ